MTGTRTLAIAVASVLAASAARAEELSRSDRRLLRRYNPILVAFPNDGARSRPGAILRGPGQNGYGDYHPISVEAFRDSGLLAPDRKRPGSPGQAWRDLPGISGRTDDGRVVYGRVVPDGDGGKILQYHYLYAYNDFVNRHEGDWEMASIRLDRHDRPVEMGLSSHYGGTRLDWRDVVLDGRRPVAFVARGSHAMYFDFKPSGYGVTDLELPRPLERIHDQLSRLNGMRDHVAADPQDPRGTRATRVGERLTDLDVRALPDWALRYEGRWGSRNRSLLRGVGSAPRGPWTKALAWGDASGWMRDLRDAPKPAPRAQQRGVKAALKRWRLPRGEARDTGARSENPLRQIKQRMEKRRTQTSARRRPSTRRR